MKIGWSALAGALIAGPALAGPQLLPLWQDGAVIQRGLPIVVEGDAAASAQITGTLGDERATATAGPDGQFALTFAAREASADPLVLTIDSGDGAPTTASDLVIGDVYLCSGQSNMAWSVEPSTYAQANIASSADPLLRMLTVPQNTAVKPARSFGGEVAWQKASPETTGEFSGACYYMLRDLRAQLGIPVGAVHASWGGSQIRAWLTPASGARLYGADQMALLDGFAENPLYAVTNFAPTYTQWWKAETGREPWANPDAEFWQAVPQISAWNEWTGSPLAENANGNVLLRQTFTLNQEQAKSGGTLGIGIIDDLDATFVNGHAVGFTHGWSNERHYEVPPEFLRAGTNEVLVIANNTWGAGGFSSGADRLFFAVEEGVTLPLGEGWRYAIGQHAGSPPRAPWDANAGIGVMHNRMIAPVGSFAFTGAAWYQGESDVGLPGYADRLRELFAGWRAQGGEQMRMLVVQLPNFGEVSSSPINAGWAQTREQQRRAITATQNAALVATLDVGDRNDLHPLNKLDIGRRLALAALGEPIMPVSATREEGGVRIAFSGVEGELAGWSGTPLGFELCGASQESCRYASARAEGDAIVLADDGLPASRVRYAWSDAPVVNTYDARELTLPTFELAIAR